VTISLAGKGGGYRFDCKLDNARKFKACHSPLKLSGLKPGNHTLLARAHDSSGTLDKTPAKATFKIKQ
jgi:hypothetical protein